MKFEYLEVRPCLEARGETNSFTNEEEFYSKLAGLVASNTDHKEFWTIYGRYNEPDPKGQPQFLACAIGDFATKEDAHKVMNAILAPMAAARDLAREDEFPLKPGVIISPAERAAYYLDDFINQSSNMERI